MCHAHAVCNSAYLVSGVADTTQLSTSGFASTSHGHTAARLLTRITSRTAWQAPQSDTFKYVQVDLGLVTTVKAVATQGREGPNHWVKTYLLTYSLDGSSWITYKEAGEIKVSMYSYVIHN